MAVAVVEANFPSVKHLGSVEKIKREHIKEDVDLIIGGFPCQDLSCIGKKAGLHGLRSKLFFEMIRLLHVFQPKWFFVENVASMLWADREEISKYLKVTATEVDSQNLTANRRRRYYWTNIPLPAKVPEELKNDVLDNHLEGATALEQKIGCIMRDNTHASGNGAIQRVYCNTHKKLRTIRVSELESLLGYPIEYTSVNFSNLAKPREFDMAGNDEHRRWNLLGNTFSVPVVTYLLSSLVRQATWKNHVRHEYSETYKEHECSMMETGELWALTSDYGVPNWYAFVENASGDRFDFIPGISRVKKPVAVRVRFLVSEREDSFSHERGTGFHTPRSVTDVEDDFKMFSHRFQLDCFSVYLNEMMIRRVTSYKRYGNAYFIYPGVGEVWALFHREWQRPDRGICYVWINKVEIDWTKVEPNASGKVDFLATCWFMQKIRKDTFRRTGTEMKFDDLSRFCARIPIIHTTEADVFYMDPIKPRKNMKKLYEPRKKRSVKQVEADKANKTRKRKIRDEEVSEQESQDDEDYIAEDSY